MAANDLGKLAYLAARDLDAGQLGSGPQAHGELAQELWIGALDCHVVE